MIGIEPTASPLPMGCSTNRATSAQIYNKRIDYLIDIIKRFIICRNKKGAECSASGSFALCAVDGTLHLQ